ncbi:protein TIFY 7-like isoform X2 [Andrographis paniculata]|uniref:protein TIFY 7-like isoform X2 n=1 Tax=Andrographis paniculata TaxID=175694 RepID=UPI0021E86FEA|nr:protein TIFY 7-like isoform X2 [Andrographis paniculata]
MERGFVGLSAKDSVIVKEDFVDGNYGDAGLMVKYASEKSVPKHEQQQLADFLQCNPNGNPIATSHPPLVPWINSKTSTHLTIFYGGRVTVFNDISPDKAQAIAYLAGNDCVQSKMAQPKLISSAIPQAHRASLARFLAKRRERLMNAAPYKVAATASDCATSGADDHGSRLCLHP